MIKRIHLENFRRHADVELDLEGDAQVILISGANGAGKSTILEAITYALYGQGRNGRTNVDNLIRRGAELEGMQVEMEFEIASTSYRVVRRRDNGLSTATLYANESSIAVGAGQVTSEISKILGMDAAGFKLATIAQQKELDGLASLRPAVRSEQIRRLLRLDAITAAADQARKVFRTERDIANALAGKADFAELTKQLEAAQGKKDAAQTALAESEKAVQTLLDEIEEGAELEEIWKDSQFKMERAQALMQSAESEIATLEKELKALVIPDEVHLSINISDLAEQVAEVERAIMRAEHSTQLAAQRDMLNKELEKAQKQAVGLGERIANLTEVENSLSELRLELEKLLKKRTGLQSKLDKSRQESSDWVSQAKMAASQLRNAQELGATCSMCGQSVSEEHRETEMKLARMRNDKASREVERCKEQEQTLNGQSLELDKKIEDMRSEIRQAERALDEKVQLAEQLGDLERRVATYSAQVERIEVVREDPDSLYARKAELAITLSQAQKAQEQERVRAEALNKQNSLREAHEKAQAALTSARETLEKARPSQEQEAAHERRAVALSSLEEEKALRGHWQTQTAVAERDVVAAKSAIESAKKAEEERKSHQARAVTAANASTVLKDVAEKLASQIRPSLEGSVGQLLGTLSEGRFEKVSIDADYNIKVEDDGKMRSLSEFSGGEVDLIALAVRLAIAQVVTERHGAGGTGFLILDEVFGSQDNERRSAILTSLRALRASYGQILLISHVGGLEDSADMVLEVTRGEESSQVRAV